MQDRQRHDLQREVFGSIYLLAQHLTRCSDEALDPLGVTTRQWLLLAVLATRFPGYDPTLSEAAEVYGSSRQNVKQVALPLEQAGYLRVVSDPEDRRVKRLQLTSKIEAFNTPEEIDRQIGIMDRMFACLGDLQIKTLQQTIHQWLAHVSRL